VKKRIPVAGATYVTCAPVNNLAIACANRERSEVLYIVDTGRGTAVARTARQLTVAKAPGPRRVARVSDFGYPTLTPDGKHLVVCSSESLHRIAVKGTNLAVEESGPRIGQNPQGIDLSIDGRYVALPSGGGNSAAPGHPEVGYGTYIYALDNLQSPKIGIKSGAYPRELSLDPFAKLIYAQNHDHQLLVIDTAGVEQGKYQLDPRGGGVRQFALHPAGRQMFVLMERALVWVEIEE
jgi:DNA-binding beta-propeller fold protein YncE